MKKALIFGITGQVGSYLAEYLLDKNYQVYGVKRRSSSYNTQRIDHIFNNPNLKLIYGDLTDSLTVTNIIKGIEPDEIYNLGAMSHVKVSFEIPEYTGQVDALGTLRILESVRLLGLEHKTKILQLSTSELFGLVQEIPQKETTPFYPRSPYGCAKAYGYYITKNYRESYDMFASNVIMFNTESPRRGETFVTKKIVMGLNDILRNRKDCLYLGNLSALRDWSHAKDMVKGFYKILQHNISDDFVLASGEQHSVKEFVEVSGKYFNMNIVWEGEGIDEIGIDKNTNKVVINVDEKYYRPAEVQTLLGDYSKAKNVLNWNPEISFEQLVEEMCEYELSR